MNCLVNASSVHDHRIALDCDGVLLNFDQSFARVASDVLKRQVAKLNNRYELDTRYGLSMHDFQYAWDALDDHEHGWRNMILLPGAVEAVRTLQAQGASIHLVTGIHARLSEQRLANLLAHTIEVESIHCVGDGKSSKTSVLRDLKPVGFVDDRLFLLNEADFVPHRVWVDHDDDQHGHIPQSGITRVESLKTWVDDHWTPQLGVVSAPAPSFRRKFSP